MARAQTNETHIQKPEISLGTLETQNKICIQTVNKKIRTLEAFALKVRFCFVDEFGKVKFIIPNVFEGSLCSLSSHPTRYLLPIIQL